MDSIVLTMIRHGHVTAVLDYLNRHGDRSEFPLRMIPTVMHQVKDEKVRQTLMRRAVEVWREDQSDEFYMVFQSQWKALPREEAREVVREIVQTVVGQPDREVTARYESIVITSARENALFCVLHVLREVDGELAEMLIASYPQLAAASRRYPKGMDSMMEEAEERRKAQGESCEGGGFVMAGDPRDFPYIGSLMQAAKDGEFGAAFEHAWEQYEKDTDPDDPNRAPKEFWASTGRYRSILCHAGRRLGKGAAALLERVPDDDLRLFAGIEMAGALAGLPDLPITTRRYGAGHRPPGGPAETRVPGAPMQSPSGTGIRCPLCDWRPTSNDRWMCRCGHRWNTFWTGGLCPACKYQWETTGCFRCGEAPAHSEWYEKDAGDAGQAHVPDE